MDPRRPSRVIDPKIRHVGFFTPAPVPNQPQDQTAAAGLTNSIPSASTSSLSPVIIHPSRAVDVPASTRRYHDDELVVGSYKPEDSVLGSSPPFSGIGEEDGDVESEYSAEYPVAWNRCNESVKVPASLPLTDGGFHLAPSEPKNEGIRVGDDVKVPASLPLIDGGFHLAPSEPKNEGIGVGDDVKLASKPLMEKTLKEKTSKSLKEKTSKAERRALQEAQRAAKLDSKAGGKPAQGRHDKAATQPLSKKDRGLVETKTAASEKKFGDRPEKVKKKDAPALPMQFDVKSHVEKAKKRSLLKQTEASNRIELFLHLPQYEHGTHQPDIASNFFQFNAVHPSVYKVGLQYLTGDIHGGNARCITMLQAFSEAIQDYSVPPDRALSRDLTTKLNSFVQFLTECRPLSVSMGNAIRFLKARVAKLTITLSETEAKASLISDIDRFISDKIVLADKAIVEHAVTKIRDGDVLLTYGRSTIVEMILIRAHDLGKQFHVVVVDSRPKFEGQLLLRKLVGMGLSCTYTHVNAVSYVMSKVTRVFLGAASIFCNGTVYSRVGTACVAMVAHAYDVPVIVCCEAYKFHERALLDSICTNELGNPDAISKLPQRLDSNDFQSGTSKKDLQHLNLMYDATPSEYVSMIVTEYGMIPATGVAVILREYGGEQPFI